MRRFVEEADRGQWTLLPECLDDFIDESNPVRVIDVFVDALDLAEMSFEGVAPAATGRPSYHPSVLLKLYIYGYLNRVQSSRRLEREAGRNVEVMWLLGRLAPLSLTDFFLLGEYFGHYPVDWFGPPTWRPRKSLLHWILTGLTWPTVRLPHQKSSIYFLQAPNFV
jgi:hypothetical protein